MVRVPATVETLHSPWEKRIEQVAARGIDIAPYELSHLAFRVPEWDQYVHLRTILERHAVANLENVWNGRPISMILLAEPLDRKSTRLNSSHVRISYAVFCLKKK